MTNETAPYISLLNSLRELHPYIMSISRHEDEKRPSAITFRIPQSIGLSLSVESMEVFFQGISFDFERIPNPNKPGEKMQGDTLISASFKSNDQGRAAYEILEEIWYQKNRIIDKS